MNFILPFIMLLVVGSQARHLTLEERIGAVTGPNPVDCGTFSLIHNGVALPIRPGSKAKMREDSMRESLACAEQAINGGGKGFKIVQRGSGIDSEIVQGVLGTADGLTYWFYEDNGHLRTRPCPLTEVTIETSANPNRTRLFRCDVAPPESPSSGAALSELTPQARSTSDPAALVQELGTFRDAMPAAAPSDGRVPPIEARREAVYRELRVLDASAAPALTRGLADADVRVRRGVALYLLWAGGNYERVTPKGLDLTTFLDPIVHALRDPDQRVNELAAHSVGLIGPPGLAALPDLVRMLTDPAEGLRNSACIGLAGIGPAARDALPALRTALSDSSADVRIFAQAAIDRIDRRR